MVHVKIINQTKLNYDHIEWIGKILRDMVLYFSLLVVVEHHWCDCNIFLLNNVCSNSDIIDEQNCTLLNYSKLHPFAGILQLVKHCFSSRFHNILFIGEYCFWPDVFHCCHVRWYLDQETWGCLAIKNEKNKMCEQ